MVGMESKPKMGTSALTVDVTPRELTVLENRNATFRCQVGVPLQYCRVVIQGIGAMNLNNKLTAKGVSYTGAGLGSGQCGFTIERVTAENNGKISCFLGVETQPEEAVGTMHLTVAKAPRAPELELARDTYGQYKVNEMLKASCIVKDGRPVANISWFLDEEPIYEGLSMPTVLDFTNDDLHTKIQNLTRQLMWSDNGRYLKCAATHPALETPSVTMRQLDVLYPPLPKATPIDLFGYELGRPGIITVEIDANPKPKLEWNVKGETLKEGGVDSTGRIQAEFPQELGRGRYVASLKIAAVNKHDTETQYVLVAYNDMGTQDYTVAISTSPEPEGLDLGAGGIIGIVVATLLLLVFVFVIVIARIKGKWCFSGVERDNPRVPVESSDTESADVRHSHDSRRAVLPTLTSLFKKKNDKVSHEEDDAPRQMETEDIKSSLEDEQKQEHQQGHDRPESENKEGLVYAELDLVNVNLKPVLKNDDEKTEYAEIVYTNDNKKQQPQS
ncbi:putative coreceptor-mediated virion attachment to host cell [Trypoxylus dichotomus]